MSLSVSTSSSLGSVKPPQHYMPVLDLQASNLEQPSCQSQPPVGNVKSSRNTTLWSGLLFGASSRLNTTLLRSRPSKQKQSRAAKLPTSCWMSSRQPVKPQHTLWSGLLPCTQPLCPSSSQHPHGLPFSRARPFLTQSVAVVHDVARRVLSDVQSRGAGGRGNP